MYKINTICKALFFKNILRTIMIYLILIILFLVFLFTMNNLTKDNTNNFLPKDMLYVELENSSVEDDFLREAKENKVDVYKTMPILFNKKNPIDVTTYYSNLKINLEGMTYSKDTPVDLVGANQHKVNKGQVIETPMISYNFTNEVVDKEGIKLPNQNYNLEEILVGKYPEAADEVLIGENMANYYLGEKNLNKYSDLLEQEIEIKTMECRQEIFCVDDIYKISGIYRGAYDDEESFIINPSEKVREVVYKKYQDTALAYFIKSSDKKAIEKMEELKYYSIVLTPKYINSSNAYNIITVLCIMLFNIVIFINYYGRIKYLNGMLNYYGVDKYLSRIIYVLPLIILNILFILIFFMVFKL